MPPAFAARLRAVLLLPPLLEEDDDDRLVLDLRPLEAVERRLEELEADEPLEELRLRPPEELLDELRPRPPDDPLEELAGLREPDPLEDLRALELREVDARELDARELDPDAFRPPDPPLDLLRDEPAPPPELDSAIALLL